MKLDPGSMLTMLAIMKHCLFIATIAALLFSLSSCGTMGRTFSSLGRTFGNYTGGQAPVIR